MNTTAQTTSDTYRSNLATTTTTTNTTRTNVTTTTATTATTTTAPDVVALDCFLFTAKRRTLL
eukprot:9475786-Pyramimonas_sp.AAC.2